jgi:hypothetical protein
MKLGVLTQTGNFLNRRRTGFSSRALLDREQTEMTHEKRHMIEVSGPRSLELSNNARCSEIPLSVIICGYSLPTLMFIFVRHMNIKIHLHL